MTIALGRLLSLEGSAAERTVAEEILEVLRAQGSISEAQYEDWSERAKAEAAGRQAPASDDPPAAEDRPLVTWDDGLRLHPSEDIEIGIGGRVYADYAFFSADDDTVDFFQEDDLDGGSGMQFSRARLWVGGTLYDTARFKAQFDFATGTVRMRDLFLHFPNVPILGNVKLGHFKEPFMLQRVTSSRHIQFMERAVPNAFSLDRNMGITAFDSAFGDRMTWSIGGFLEVNEQAFEFSKDGTHNVVVRVTGLALDRAEENQLLHLGFSYVHRFVGDQVRFDNKPEANLSPVQYVDTGLFDARGVDQIDSELAFVWGPFSLQSEYTMALVDSDETGDPSVNGFYVQAGWFLTGDHRSYDRKLGFFERVRPQRNFSFRGGPGAWQVGLRYSWVDLKDGAFSELVRGHGRRLDNITVGLNGFLNPYMRMMFNYVRADLDEVGITNIVQSRVQFDF